MCISVFVIILSIFLSSVLVVAQKKEEANRTNLFVKENEVKTLFEEYDSYQVEFNWKPASKRTYVYTSKAPNIATVNEKGVITPIAKGQTEIRADYEKNGKKYFDILNVTVRSPYVFIKNKITTLPIGETYIFKINIGGSNSDVGDFEWSVSDKKIGSITTGKKTAVFTAKKEGEVKIKVRDKKTGGTSSCVVKAISDVAPFGIRNLVDKLWCDVDYKFYTQGTKNKVKWEVSDQTIATISDNGVITGLKAGEITVSVTDEKTKEKRNYPITIQWIPETPIEKFEYREIDGTIQIIGLKDTNITEVRIPEKVGGKQVIYDEEARTFYLGDQVKTLIIPKTIDLSEQREMGLGGNSLERVIVLNRDTEINLHCFESGALKLQEYIIPYSCKLWLVDSVGNGNFYALKSLTRVYFPEIIIWENQYGEGVEGFSNCENMELVFPNTIKEIKKLCNNCKNMRIIIPRSVTKISKEAFKNCKNSEITIVTPKGSYAEKYAKENDYPYEYYYE